MRKLLVFILLLFALSSSGQKIGDRLQYLLDNQIEFNLTLYRIYDDYFEFCSVTDTLIVSYIMDLETKVVFGIDYLYPDKDRLNKGLLGVLNGTHRIGNNIYVRHNEIIFITKQEIYIRDVEYITE
jgi:hypothetical protein